MARETSGASDRARALLRSTLGLLAAVLCCVSCGTRAETPNAAILVVLDTLRADALGVYGGTPDGVSPHIDSLAAQSVLFEQAISHASWTLPGFVGLLSGHYPSKRVFDASLQHSLVEPLRDAGFQTAAFTEGAFVSRHFGFDRGFEVYSEEEGAVRLRGGAERETGPAGGIEHTFSLAIEWLRDHAGERFFLMIHTYEVHTPYRRREYARALPRGLLGETFEIADLRGVESGSVSVGPEEVAYARALYAGGVRAADEWMGSLLATLDELGIGESTLVVVTSDHGEDLGERSPRHLADHGYDLYDSVIRIPLLIRDPVRAFPMARVSETVRSIDIMPTVLDLLGVSLPADMDGRSLAPLMAGMELTPVPAYAELQYKQSSRVRTASLRHAGRKLIANSPPLRPGQPVLELYDVADDPAEQRNLVELEPEILDELAALLRAQRSELGEIGRSELGAGDVSGELRERLRALGYVE